MVSKNFHFIMLLISCSLLITANIPNENNIKLIESDMSEKDLSGLVKILNYNTVEAGQNPEWKEIIRQENPDILIQVETGSKDNLPGWRDELNSYFEDEIPYEVVGFDAVSTTDGQAIYSRFPIKSTEVIDYVTLDDGTEHKMNHPYMQAIIEIEGIEIMFLANHLSCCDNLAARLLEHEGLMNYFDTVDSSMPILYGGDFNSLTSQDTEVDYLAPMQDNLDTIPIDMMINSSHPLAPKDHIFFDTYRDLNPDRKGFTLNHQGSYTSIDHFRDRIDYIFVNQHMTKYLVNSSVVTDHPAVITASDHKPMYTWFNFKSDSIDLRPPLNPQKVAVTDFTNNYPTITWSPNTEIDLLKYSIYRNGTLLTDIDKSITAYTDNYQYELNKVYIYQITATDIYGNEGRKSLPILINSSYGELFAPYNIELKVSSADSRHKVEWFIHGTSNISNIFIKIFKALQVDDTFIIDRKLENISHNGSFYLPYNSRADLKIRITAGNVIGETGVVGPTYHSRSNQTVVGQIDPDRYDTHQYENFLTDMNSNIDQPIQIIDIPIPVLTNTTLNSTTEISTTENSNNSNSSTIIESTLVNTSQTYSSPIDIQTNSDNAYLFLSPLFIGIFLNAIIRKNKR